MSAAKAFARRIGGLLGESGRAMVGVERGKGWARVLCSGESPRSATSLRELVDALGLRGRASAAMLEGSEVVVRRLTLPPMKGADLRASLALECRNLIGYPIEEAVIRHEVLGRSAEGTGIDVLVAVAPRRAVEETCRALESAGLVPRRLTIRAVALRSLLRSRPGLERDEAVAYLDLGPRESYISIFRGDEIRFTRECGIGVASFIDALRSIVVPGQGVRLLDPSEAEALLLTQGVLGGSEERPPASEIPASAVLVMLRPSLERLVRELWNSVDYVHEQFQGQTVSRIVILGETARVPGLAAHLAGVLKMPVQTVDSESEEGALAWGAVAGLSHQDPGALDFLEPSDLGPLSRLAEAVQPKVAIAATAVLLLSVSLPAEMGVHRERVRVLELEKKLASVAPYADQVVRFRGARGVEASSDAVMRTLRGQTPPWAEVLRDLSHRVGQEARLTSVAPVEPKPEDADATAGGTPDGAVIRIEGLVRRERLRPEAPLGDLMASLERSPYVDRVTLETCQATGAAQSRFVLVARLTGGGAP